MMDSELANDMRDTLNVVVLEPYYGGSHAAFVDALVKHTRHQMCVATMPARKWKWRMRGAATWFVRDENQWLKGQGGRGVDLILCNDMLSVSDLRAMLPRSLRNVPIICYFHENQLTYPMPCEEDRDYHCGMTNITSCLAVDAVWFNSMFHLEDFLAAAGRLLRKMPDCVPTGVIESIRAKSTVMPPPIDVPEVLSPPQVRSQPARCKSDTPRILWSHRWEYDKNPEPFFEALIRLADTGQDFELVLLGEQFRTAPTVFSDGWPQLKNHIVHAGFLPDRQSYWRMIATCDLVVSSAIQENFGLSIVEAILAGCQPLLPHRLAYPELIPAEFHSKCLYNNDLNLFKHIQDLVTGSDWLDRTGLKTLQSSLFSRFAASQVVPRMDTALAAIVSSTN